MDFKRILTIQDISCLGQCSLTVALPILSACGFETCIIPTAMLSAHTAFQKPAIRQLADMMPEIREHWLREQISFDAVYTGYLGSGEAVSETLKIADSLLTPGGIFIVDPAMADNGKLYSGFDDQYAEKMKMLCKRADIILPNITEAAMMSGLPFQEQPSEEYVEELLLKLNHPCTVLTGAGFRQDETGAAILNCGKRYDYRHKKYPGNFHGTGDLFASCFVGAFLKGKKLQDAAKIASDVVCSSIAATVQDPGHWYGVKFETAIPELIRMLNP